MLQGPPSFEQADGIVDEPCAVSKVVSSCTAHVVLVNRGGEGLGHATIVVPLKDSGGTASAARTLSTAKCGTQIPDTAAGGNADLTCAFYLPIGKAVAAYPTVWAIDYTVAVSPSSSGGDLSGIATFVFAAAAAVFAVAALGTAVAGRRRRTTGSPTAPP